MNHGFRGAFFNEGETRLKIYNPLLSIEKEV